MKRTRGLGQTLAFGFALCALITALFAAFTIYQVNQLGVEQDIGARRSHDALTALDASHMAEQEYSIIADLIINRNLEEGSKNWNDAKESDLKKLEIAAQIADTEIEKQHAKEATEAWLAMTQIVDKELLPLLKDKNPSLEQITKIDGELDLKKKVISEKLASISEAMEKEAKDADHAFDQTRKQIFLFSILFAVLGLAGAGIVATLIIRSVTGRVRTVSDSLSSGSKEVSSAAIKIAETSAELSASAVEQASAIQETVSSVDEVNAMVGKTAENAKKSFHASKSSNDAAVRGKTAIEEMIGAINDIDQSNNDVSRQLIEGNQKISEITKVIAEIGNKTKVINDIVFQTKLLSFNASVEAARAGGHGKGFSVVAEEVGNLAQMSGNAAKEIAQLLDGSIKKVEGIVRDTTQQVEQLTSVGKQKISQGTETAKRCGNILNEIVVSVNDVSQLVEEITNASQEQAQGVQEISKAMGQLDEVTHQNTKASEQASVAGEQLNVQASGLAQLVRDLKELIEGSGGAPKVKPQAMASEPTPALIQHRRKSPTQPQTTAPAKAPAITE
ncbi:MAG: hypothetical protein A2Z97_11280, partial [Bdellovibrionales bacterium GWB1_52_6]